MAANPVGPSDQRAQAVLELLKNESSAAAIAERYGVDEAELRRWRDAFVRAGQEGLGGKPSHRALLGAATGNASETLMKAGLQSPRGAGGLNPLAGMSQRAKPRRTRNDRRDSTNYFGLNVAISGHGIEGQIDTHPDHVAMEMGLPASLKSFSDYPKYRLAVELGHRENRGKTYTEYGVFFDSHEIDVTSDGFGAVHLDRDDLGVYARVGYRLFGRLGVSLGGHVTATKANVHTWIGENEYHDRYTDVSVGPSASISYEITDHVETSCSAYMNVGDMDIMGSDPIYTCGVRVKTR